MWSKHDLAYSEEAKSSLQNAGNDHTSDREAGYLWCLLSTHLQLWRHWFLCKIRNRRWLQLPPRKPDGLRPQTLEPSSQLLLATPFWLPCVGLSVTVATLDPLYGIPAVTTASFLMVYTFFIWRGTCNWINTEPHHGGLQSCTNSASQQIYMA